MGRLNFTFGHTFSSILSCILSCILSWIFTCKALAQVPQPAGPAPEVVEKFQNTRAGISQDERRQREALGHLFLINKKVKEIARNQQQLNQKMLSFEANIRDVA